MNNFSKKIIAATSSSISYCCFPQSIIADETNHRKLRIWISRHQLLDLKEVVQVEELQVVQLEELLLVQLQLLAAAVGGITLGTIAAVAAIAAAAAAIVDDRMILHLLRLRLHLHLRLLQRLHLHLRQRLRQHLPTYTYSYSYSYSYTC